MVHIEESCFIATVLVSPYSFDEGEIEVYEQIV